MEYYSETGYLKSVTASYVQSFEYAWDDLGNMTDRYDHLHKINNLSLHEHFTYDNRSQLRDTYLNGLHFSSIKYDNLGNITSKTATGGFEYQSAGSPYRLTSIVPDQNIDPGYKLSQNITYTDFNKVASITGNGYKLEIEYGLGNQRISQSLSSVNQYGQTTLLLNKHFIGGLQEKIFYETGTEKTISYITSPEGLTAIEVKSGITSEWYTVFTDHLGSITTLIRESDGNRFELSYDAWGNRRNPATCVNYSGNLPDFIAITDTAFITDRGFTEHEQLDMFGLINMNGRVYDPVASRFLSPDSFIQAPELALNYNGYVYCLNNPLVYTDPSGEFVWFAVAVSSFVFFTDPGYQLQKYISPVAFKVDIKIGTHQKGLGYDVSVGVPKSFPYAKRWERGDTYFWKNFGNYSGWESRTGTETSYLGIYTKSTTHYKAGEFTQTLGRMSFGIPGVAGVDVSNDLFGDKGDRYRTSHVRINLGGVVRLGNSLFTGVPGLRDRNRQEIDGYETYVKGPYGEDPDKYRNGILYLGIGPIEIGWDSEAIRNRIQNHWIHKNMNPPSPFFKDLRGTDEYDGDRFYFQFGWGGLW